jgi:uncharacterized protein YcfL
MADADRRLDPAAVLHALNAADVERSQARLADISVGLSAAGKPGDRAYWRDKAQRRVAALEEDDADFGLFPHEQAELEQLKAMLAGANARLAQRGNG